MRSLRHHQSYKQYNSCWGIESLHKSLCQSMNYMFGLQEMKCVEITKMKLVGVCMFLQCVRAELSLNSGIEFM